MWILSQHSFILLDIESLNVTANSENIQSILPALTDDGVTILSRSLFFPHSTENLLPSNIHAVS